MRLFSALWELLFPYIPKCVVCGTEKNVTDYLCPACVDTMQSLTAGKTQAAGLDAVSAFDYDGPAARTVQRYKYGGSRYLSAFMAQAMLRAAIEANVPFDCLCHVPLHPKKRRKRGFDQAALLADRLAALTGKPHIHAVQRVRNTPSQTKLTMAQRKANMSGAFEAVQRTSGRVLLIDDVFTTGATAAECAGVLECAGAASVTVLTFARAMDFRQSAN